MIARYPFNSKRAFARREVLFIIIGIVLLALLIFPSLMRGHGKSHRASCLHRLKHVGLAFNLWSGDHDGLFPMQYYTNEPGEVGFANRTNSYIHFQVMSNELHLSSVLACPADKSRKYATNFTDLSAANLSYFVGLDAAKKRPASFLTGDRNISTGTEIPNGRLSLAPGQPVSWTGELHDGAGNISRADGSVLELNSKQLRKALAATALATNRLVLP